MKRKQLDYSRKSLEQELEYFTDGNIAQFIKNCVEDFPAYFWTAPASGTGKYHDEEDNGEGGLVKHTRRVIRVVEELANLNGLSYWETDVLRAAAILHDAFSKGLNGNTDSVHTDVFHPLYVRFSFPFVGYADRFIEERTYDDIMLCVESHSGRWSVSKLLYSDKKLPKLFQTADYIGSRRNIRVNPDRIN